MAHETGPYHWADKVQRGECSLDDVPPRYYEMATFIVKKVPYEDRHPYELKNTGDKRKKKDGKPQRAVTT